ncbi:unnamed protein product [Trichogramma brassicae]|uniref:Uncharacterized protein n=1 Tax=Trichogramma brassicae TaxID=86971 RepID=A0A6H5I9D3_9HYME|nr:unnamed protein product [Trichogramma brassicae]
MVDYVPRSYGRASKIPAVPNPRVKARRVCKLDRVKKTVARAQRNERDGDGGGVVDLSTALASSAPLANDERTNERTYERSERRANRRRSANRASASDRASTAIVGLRARLLPRLNPASRCCLSHGAAARMQQRPRSLARDYRWLEAGECDGSWRSSSVVMDYWRAGGAAAGLVRAGVIMQAAHRSRSRARCWSRCSLCPGSSGWLPPAKKQQQQQQQTRASSIILSSTKSKSRKNRSDRFDRNSPRCVRFIMAWASPRQLLLHGSPSTCTHSLARLSPEWHAQMGFITPLRELTRRPVVQHAPCTRDAHQTKLPIFITYARLGRQKKKKKRIYRAYITSQSRESRDSHAHASHKKSLSTLLYDISEKITRVTSTPRDHHVLPLLVLPSVVHPSRGAGAAPLAQGGAPGQAAGRGAPDRLLPARRAQEDPRQAARTERRSAFRTRGALPPDPPGQRDGGQVRRPARSGARGAAAPGLAPEQAGLRAVGQGAAGRTVVARQAGLRSRGLQHPRQGQLREEVLDDLGSS